MMMNLKKVFTSFKYRLVLCARFLRAFLILSSTFVELSYYKIKED